MRVYSIENHILVRSASSCEKVYKLLKYSCAGVALEQRALSRNSPSFFDVLGETLGGPFPPVTQPLPDVLILRPRLAAELSAKHRGKHYLMRARKHALLWRIIHAQPGASVYVYAYRYLFTKMFAHIPNTGCSIIVVCPFLRSIRGPGFAPDSHLKLLQVVVPRSPCARLTAPENCVHLTRLHHRVNTCRQNRRERHVTRRILQRATNRAYTASSAAAKYCSASVANNLWYPIKIFADTSGGCLLAALSLSRCSLLLQNVAALANKPVS